MPTAPESDNSAAADASRRSGGVGLSTPLAAALGAGLAALFAPILPGLLSPQHAPAAPPTPSPASAAPAEVKGLVKVPGNGAYAYLGPEESRCAGVVSPFGTGRATVTLIFNTVSRATPDKEKKLKPPSADLIPGPLADTARGRVLDILAVGDPGRGGGGTSPPSPGPSPSADPATGPVLQPTAKYLAAHVDFPASPRRVAGVLNVPLTVRGKAGHYTGSLLVGGADGDETAYLPVAVDLKDSALLPFLTLAVLSSALAVANAYRKRRGSLDSVWSRLGLAATTVEQIGALRTPGGAAEPFRARLIADFDDAGACLRQRDTIGAAKALDRAEAVRSLFAQNPDGWGNTLDMVEQNRKKLTTNYQVVILNDAAGSSADGGAARHPAALLQSLLKLSGSAPDAKSYAALYDAAIPLIQQVERYFELLKMAQAIVDRAATSQLTANAKERVQEAARDVGRQWSAADPNDTQAFADLHKTLEAQLEALKKEIPEAAPNARRHSFGVTDPAAGAGSMGGAATPALPHYLTPPLPRPRDGLITPEARRSARAARAATSFYANAAMGVVIALTVALGMKETYFSNAVFGADGWSDYIPVIVWGLGGSATSQILSAAIAALGGAATAEAS